MVYYNSTYCVPKFDTTARSYLYYLKIVYLKLSFIIVLLLSLFLLVGYNSNALINEKINTIINVSSKPCVYTIYFIDASVKKVFNSIGNMIFMYKENTYLKEQNAKLKEKAITIHNLEYENKKLKNLINFIGVNNIANYTTVKYNVITKNKFENKIRLSIGKNNDIKDNDIVVDGNGNYLGKTIRTTDNSTEIMLLTDINSKVEAITLKNKVKLILNGNNTPYLNIVYMNDNEYKLLEEDYVFFINNNQQKDFYIGKIVKVDNEFKVKIGNNFNYIDYVTIISF